MLSTCPYCGHTSLDATDMTLQEIDTELLTFKPPETLTELECKDCGWFGTKVHLAH